MLGASKQEDALRRIYIPDAQLVFEFKLPRDAVLDIARGIIGCLSRDKEMCPYEEHDEYKIRGYRLGQMLVRFAELHDIVIRKSNITIKD